MMPSSKHPVFVDLDLEPIVTLAMLSEAGPRWTRKDAVIASDLYRSFLWLCWAYPEENIVPNSVIDQFWHLHILDTKRYEIDCQNIFGRMLHHNPFLGLRNDETKLHTSFARTLALVSKHFPELVS